jgi:hypothetical protein
MTSSPPSRSIILDSAYREFEERVGEISSPKGAKAEGVSIGG